MILTLRMTADHGGPPEERRLERGTMMIGRGAENDWVMSDAERTLSKTHCRIDQSGDGFLLTDLSTNGVFINEETLPVGRGRSRSLADEDVIVLGPFHLVASIAAGGPAPDLDEAVRPAPPPSLFTGVQHTAGSPIVPPAEPWLDEIPAGEFGPDRHVLTQSWDAPIDPAEYSAHDARQAEHPLDGPATFSTESEHASPIATVMKLPATQSVLPTDWNDADPLAALELAPSPFDIAPARPTEPSGSAPDPARIPIPNEELLAALAPAVPVRAASPEIGAGALDAAVLEEVAPARSAPTQIPAAAEAHAASAERSSVIDAFLEGAGLPPEALGGMTPEETARDLGRLVRAAVEGAREILATRAMVKAELRVDQTIIQAVSNNPMKFAPDVQRCLAAMVGQPPPGFLAGSAAMTQSMDDIQRHELALVAALNGVFGNLTERLDPEAIMTKVRAESSLNTILPYAREARCWALYVEQYQALQATDADNTGGSLLAPLAAAYARQLRRAE